ncbi:SDR family NAD(P)-dependent oxidoreductase [Marinospirillum sp.]|uniref:SDR family NAD(P)-dependent oxidoreductase n=1 Tax=Marinospirillum sp. TaxID=2183934 RepID=UPI003A8AA6E2
MKPKDQPLKIWLTGAGSGIGRALALHLAQQGHQLVVSGRSEAPLLALAAEQPHCIIPLVCDVTDADSVRQAAQRIEARLGYLDQVILNAGTCEYIDQAQVDLALVRRVMETNFLGLVACVEVALPLLKKVPLGHQPRLVAISSAAALAPLPRAEAYGASKAAVSYFMESLRLDLAQQGVAVTVVYPGFVATPLTAQNDFPMPMQVTAAAMAEAIVRGVARGRPEIRYPLFFVGLVGFLGRLPFRLRQWLSRKMVR